MCWGEEGGVLCAGVKREGCDVLVVKSEGCDVLG